MAERVIVKVQVPLFCSSHSTAMCLVYDKNREHAVEQTISDVVHKELDGDPKGYFEAKWNKRSWAIGHRVGDQNW